MEAQALVAVTLAPAAHTETNMYRRSIMSGTYGYRSVLPCGRYGGHTIEFVIRNDPDYLRWCYDRVPNFRLERGAYFQYKAALRRLNMRHPICPCIQPSPLPAVLNRSWYVQ